MVALIPIGVAVGFGYFQGIRKLNNWTEALEHYSIGRDFREGNNGRVKDKVKAVYHFQISQDCGGCGPVGLDPSEQIRDVFQYTYNPDVLFEIGLLYHNGEIGLKFHRREGVSKNTVEARRWYERAITYASQYPQAQDKYRKAMRHMGVLYLYGEGGFIKDYVMATKFFQQSLDGGYVNAKQDLDWMMRASLPPDVSISIALLYRDGNGIVRNLETAKQWYEKACQNGEGKHHHQLGLQYEFGLLGEKRPELAAKYYHLAKSKGWPVSNCIQRLAQTLSAEDWDKLGEMYYFGKDGKNVDNQIAYACYKQVILLDPSHYRANSRLGWLCEFVTGIQNFTEARKHYERISDDKTRFKSYYRTCFKRIERKIAEDALLHGRSLSEIDEKGRTALHRAAENKCLKLYATLLYLGADPKVEDKLQRKPGGYLSDDDKEKVRKLDRSIKIFAKEIKEPAFVRIAERILPRQQTLDDNATVETLIRLYQIPAIRPLFDLAKLATMGRHNHSRRREVLVEEYDSDDEEVMNEEQRFSIQFDPNKTTLENIFCYGEDGVSTSSSALGLYFHANQIYVGSGTERDPAHSTLIHELCHFLAKEVFDNSCKPYAEDDAINKQIFTGITNKMKERYDNKGSLLPIFADVFKYYSEEKFHNELIVRVAEFIAKNINGLAILEKLEPDLLKYYQEVFLTKVTEHRNRLLKKAIGDGWSQKIYTFEKRTCSMKRGRPDEEALLQVKRQRTDDP